jgi:hypothetical protein
MLNFCVGKVGEGAREAVYRAGGSIDESIVHLPQGIEMHESNDLILYRAWDQADLIRIRRKWFAADCSVSILNYEQCEQEAIRLYC